jgi:ATP-dependent DNA helicase DinG
MRKAAEEFGRRRRGDEPWNTILVQGDAPRGQLVARFKAEVGSVLLGLDSFWEGVDVPGEALSVVVIDRLPFATPDDPVLDAVDATLPGGAFKTWSLPRAVTAIRQGQGRLIRAKTDRGVVVILDDRIVNAGYGQAFLRSLPPMRLSRRLEDVASFLGASQGEDSV